VAKKEVRVEDLKPDQQEVLLDLYGQSHQLLHRWRARETAENYALERLSDKERNSQSRLPTESLIYKYKAIFKELENMGLITHKRKLKERINSIMRDPPIMPPLYYDADKEKATGKDSYGLTDKGFQLGKQIRDSVSKKSIATKVSSFIFLLVGLIFMAVHKFTATGNVIGAASSTSIPFFLSLGLMIIGGVLLFQSFKKK
jgi:hypothetical protein